MRELEVKLLAGSEVDLDRLAEAKTLAGCRLVPAGETVQEDLYLDTGDLALLRSGRAYRHRRRGGRTRAALKDLGVPAEGGLLHDRREVEVEVPEGGAPAAELPPGEIRAELEPLLAGRPLGVVVRIVTRRRKLDLVAEEGPAAELCLDAAEVFPGEGGAAAGRFFEVECEDRGGGREILLAAGRELLARPGLSPSGRTKLERALDLAGLSPRAGRRGG